MSNKAGFNRNQWLENRQVRVLAVDGTQNHSLLITTYIIVMLGVFLLLPQISWAIDQNVSVLVNGCPKEFNPSAFSREGTTYVPLRQGVEAVGAQLQWDAPNSRAIITSGNNTAIVTKFQGLIINGLLFIPLRMVGEALDCHVAWDAPQKTVQIETRETAPVPT